MRGVCFIPGVGIEHTPSFHFMLKDIRPRWRLFILIEVKKDENPYVLYKERKGSGDISYSYCINLTYGNNVEIWYIHFQWL